MFEHGVEHNQQFAHARDQRHLLRLTSRLQPLVKVPVNRVMAAGHQPQDTRPCRTRLHHTHSRRSPRGRLPRRTMGPAHRHISPGVPSTLAGTRPQLRLHLPPELLLPPRRLPPQRGHAPPRQARPGRRIPRRLRHPGHGGPGTRGQRRDHRHQQAVNVVPA